ncbi:MAG: DUF4249 family protein, partial [Fibrobacter sp.]|nr:DUF4249 family protein [Fibrobacter sp.]
MFIISSALVSSCIKDITLKLPQADSFLVVDGYIDKDDYPVVFLSSSMAYFTELDTNAVKDLQIDDSQATVIVSDGIQSDTLKYLPIQRWPYMCFRGTKITGQENRRYDLKIKYKGDTYTASTSIPKTVGLDTIMANFLNDTFATLQVRWTDPRWENNYYSVHVRTQDQPMHYRPYMVPHITLDGNDYDGKTMSFPMILKGLERNTYYNDFFTKEDEDSI